MFRKTERLIEKRVSSDRYSLYTRRQKIKIITYWFLIFPIYVKREILSGDYEWKF